MTTQKKPKQRGTHALIVDNEKGKSEHRQLAEIKLSPDVMNTLTAEAYAKSLMGEIDFTEAVAVMKEKTAKIAAGDLSDLETTLAAQVVSLNAIFTTLARSSANSGYLNQMEAKMRLALKAQAQCARTAEILAAIKNPPIVYAKQANIAQGHQQINNHEPHMRTGKTKIAENELLSEVKSAALDGGGAFEASGIDQDLAALEIFDRR